MKTATSFVLKFRTCSASFLRRSASELKRTTGDATTAPRSLIESVDSRKDYGINVPGRPGTPERGGHQGEKLE